MRILILLLYWERPFMVRHALNSVLKANQHHQDWELAFIDDSSPTPGRPVCEEILRDHLDKVRFYHTNMSPEEKRETGGMVGRMMNQAIQESDADIAIMLCDDDALVPTYLKDLDNFFSLCPEEVACHSHVYTFNPAFEDPDYVTVAAKCFNHEDRIILAAHVDASQVAWRTSLAVRFDERRTKCLDYHFYGQLDRYGKTPFSGFYSQYKGAHPTALSHQDTFELWSGKSADIPECEQLTPVSHLCDMIKHYIRSGNKNEARRICEKAIELHPAETALYILLKEACDV